MTAFEKKAIDELIEHIMGLNYGESIKHEEIAERLNVKYGTHKYRSLVCIVKAALLKSGKALKALVGYGYQVMEPDEYISMSARHMKKAANSMSKGQAYCDYAPISEMSPEAAEATKLMQDKIVAVASFVGANLPEVNRISRKRIVEKAMNNGGRK